MLILRALVGSGPGGVITREDVTGAQAPDLRAGERRWTTGRPELVEGPGTDARRSPASAPARTYRIPIKGVRKSTADAMVRSAFTLPHVSVWLDCDVTRRCSWSSGSRPGVSLPIFGYPRCLIIAKAVCLALGRTPELNSFWDEPAQEIVLKKLDQPRDRRRDAARAPGSQHQGRRVARSRSSSRLPSNEVVTSGARGQDSARRHGGRHVLDHQHRRLWRRRRCPDL